MEGKSISTGEQPPERETVPLQEQSQHTTSMNMKHRPATSFKFRLSCSQALLLPIVNQTSEHCERVSFAFHGVYKFFGNFCNSQRIGLLDPIWKFVFCFYLLLNGINCNTLQEAFIP